MAGDAAADGELLRRAAAGDSRAWRDLVDAHSDPLFRYTYRLVGERDAAEDVVQEAYLRLWRQSRRWRPEAPVRAWLFRVAGNLSIDTLRRRRHIVEMEPDHAEAAPGIEDRLAEKEQARAVQRLVSELPERQRKALVLCRLEGMSMAEAGLVLRCSVGAVESLLSRARRHLRSRMTMHDGAVQEPVGSVSEMLP